MTWPSAPNPEVSVVIPTRNRRGWLEKCVESVRAQVGVRYEVIVVDDASTDETWEWLQGQTDLQVVRFAAGPERSAARNQGLAMASGPLVMFLDDDDWLWPDALRVLAGALRAAPEAVAAVGARWVWFTAERYERREAHPRVPMMRDIFDELLFGWSAVSGQTLYRTAVVREIGGYEGGLISCEDRDLWLRLARRGRVVLRPEIVMTYRAHPGQIRPAAIRHLRERVARRAIRALPAGQRRRALVLRRGTHLLDRSEDAFIAGHPLAGMGHAVRAFANSPGIFFSPLIGEWVFRRLAGRFARYCFPARVR